MDLRNIGCEAEIHPKCGTSQSGTMGTHTFLHTYIHILHSPRSVDTWPTLPYISLETVILMIKQY